MPYAYGCQKKDLTSDALARIIVSMARTKKRQTMTELLKEALARCGSLRAVERATGVKNQTLSRFLAGKQSLRLDKADALAEHLGIVCKLTRQRRR